LFEIAPSWPLFFRIFCAGNQQKFISPGGIQIEIKVTIKVTTNKKGLR
jgi:hypothetical protein